MIRSYSPYGVMGAHPLTTLAFHGQRRDPLSGSYPLGNGYRHYSPTLMRFLSPDSLSPFDRGGINAYAYCGGDPVNRTDESGRFWIKFLTHVAFGSSAVAGTGNMVVSRMRARINSVPLPDGVLEPALPRLHPRVAAAANVLDTYAYTTSVVVRGPHIADTFNPGAVANIQPALNGADLGRAGAGFLGYAALPMNARHEWRRAGVRGMPRGRLIGESLLDAYGLSYMWQAVRSVSRAVGSAVSGALGGLTQMIRGRRRPVDVETGIDNTHL
ncbi:RHS repeat-associated core domain-containing protein [Pseudomonas sp. NBRC 111124]|uniref:RHS repeat-associated core domain-containing protein n=1 Tax=Pseudomonas sp. NBRC 111124 TaxID=1661039 RepID=UPI0009EC3555